jgi:ribosomal protein S18 acetylase RimI-like enzyme
MEPIILNLKIKTYKKQKMWRGLYFNKGWLKMYVQGLVAGRLKILDMDQPACYVSHFNVKEVFRNQGYGQQLFQAAVDMCKQKGCTALSLHCSISNDGALRFYK